MILLLLALVLTSPRPTHVAGELRVRARVAKHARVDVHVKGDLQRDPMVLLSSSLCASARCSTEAQPDGNLLFTVNL